MQGRARQGTERAHGGSLREERWFGLAALGPADVEFSSGAYSISIPGLLNVSTSAGIDGNLRLEFRQANSANRFYTLDDQLLADLNVGARGQNRRGRLRRLCHRR